MKNINNITKLTIPEIHTAMDDNNLTATELVMGYLERVDDFNDEINAIVTLNENALSRAQELDQIYSDEGFVGPLHGIPLIIKDNIDTSDIPTTGGAKMFEGVTPPEDAFSVARLKDEGAIIIGKSNTPDFARGNDGYSSFGGQTRNPYDLEYIPGGSSSGTGAGVASDLAVGGLATETGVSIRNPATTNGVVGIAPTRGLVSRNGVMPISFTQDRVGPHARNVEDAAYLLEAIAGFDPQDHQTSRCINRIPDSYIEKLSDIGLDGTRVGVVRELFDHEDVSSIINNAIDDIEHEGAEIVDPVSIQSVIDRLLPKLDPVYPDDDTSLISLLDDARMNEYELPLAWEHYLQMRTDDLPYETLQDIIDDGGLRESIRKGYQELPENGIKDPKYIERVLRINLLQETFRLTMAEDNLDLFVFPTKPKPTPKIEDGEGPSRIGSENCLSAITGFPSVVVPAGFTKEGLPECIEFFGLPFSEPRLLGYAQSYESTTNHRRPPKQF